MGRGRGGNSRGKRRGGGSGFRGGSSRGGRFGLSSMSRKDAAHMRQFGEKHPSQELSNDFGEAPASKRGKFSRGRGGRMVTQSRNFSGGAVASRDARSSSESESSESESEQTPYNELLSVFTGKKAGMPVQIVSDDEMESDSEDDEKEQGGDLGSGSDSSDEKLGKEEVDEDDDESISYSEGDDNVTKQLEDATGEVDQSDGEDSKSDGENKEGSQEKENDLPEATNDEEEVEDTVIEDAEIDPEMEDVDGQLDLGSKDPFVEHFESEMTDQLQKEIKKEKPTMQSFKYDWPRVEQFTYLGLKKFEEENWNIEKPSIDLSDFDKLPPVSIPNPPSKPTSNPTLKSLHIKAQLHSMVPLVNQASIDKESCSQPLTSLQTELIDLASRYHDIYFPLRTFENAEEIRLAYCLHAANHVLKTRTRILHHNAKMANKAEVPEAYRDQGFVRPKVLILVPFKDCALRIVQTLISLILKEEKGNVANKKRFVDEFGGETLFMPKTNPKPEDYMLTFNGNVEDNFKIGMAVTKKSIKLYTGFYSSDIIVASPLGLRMIIGAEGEKDRDYDFLSSIEVLIMDQSDIFLMQNWDHVLHVMRHLHMQPVTTHGTDFARIRPWALDGLAKYYCQTLMFSSVACPEHSSLMSKYCKNYAGQVRMIQTNLKGSISQVTVQLPQVFQNFDCGSIKDVDDARFEFFTKNVLPNFKAKLMSHTLIFVSSYFDFVRLRNYFKREQESFVQICEYTKDKKIARARDFFYNGPSHFLLYTERAHFFRRFRLKGIGHIIFYQLPQSPQFYPELCNFIQENFQPRRVKQRKNSSVNVIYCKYDAPRLAAVVGTERAGYMISSEKKIHAFVSGEL